MILLHDVERSKLEPAVPYQMPAIASGNDEHLARAEPCSPALPLEKIWHLSTEFNKIAPIPKMPQLADYVQLPSSHQTEADEP
jgi:hypothetical protein